MFEKKKKKTQRGHYKTELERFENVYGNFGDYIDNILRLLFLNHSDPKREAMYFLVEKSQELHIDMLDFWLLRGFFPRLSCSCILSRGLIRRRKYFPKFSKRTEKADNGWSNLALLLRFSWQEDERLGQELYNGDKSHWIRGTSLWYMRVQCLFMRGWSALTHTQLSKALFSVRLEVSVA